MHFDQLTINEGLSHNTVFCLLQDRHGYIWMGTQNGLNQFNGYEFKVYRSDHPESDNEGFVGRVITALFEDSQGNIWVGTRKKGINFKAKSTDRFVNLCHKPEFASLKGIEITSFFEDRSGKIWISSLGGGVLRYDPETGDYFQFTTENSDLSLDVTFDVAEDKNGTIWVSTVGEGINYMPADSEKFFLSNVDIPGDPNMDGYRKVLLLEDDQLWIGVEGNGLYHLDIATGRYTHFSPNNGSDQINSNLVRDIVRGNDGRLYIATDGGGLNVYNDDTGKFQLYNYQIGEFGVLNSNALFCLLQDRVGNLWIGSYNGGVNVHKFNKTRFQLFSPGTVIGNELEHRSVLSLLQTRDGKIWVGTDGGGLSWLNKDQNGFSFSSLKNNPLISNTPGSNVIKTIFEDRQGILWIGTFNAGLYRYDPVANIFTHYIEENDLPYFLSGNNVWTIVERQDGHLWVGTVGGGISVVHPDRGVVQVHDHDPADPNSVGETNIMTLFVSSDDKVWVGTVDQGLDIYDDNTGHFYHFKYDSTDFSSLSNDEVRAIFEDSRGNIWIGTEGGGLNKWLGDGKFERFTTEDGLLANSVMGITEDHNGMLWITSFEGITRFDPQTREIRNFYFHSGQTNNQFNQMAILTAEDGQLFFGGINGLNTIWPEQVKEELEKPVIIFTDFKVLNNSISIGKQSDGRVLLKRPIEEAEAVHLNYLDKSFSIDFSAIDFIDPYAYTYAYQMEGFDDDWQETNPGQHSVTYTNLDPGNFIFRVKLKGGEASIKINIQPPFWKTLWFKTLLSLFLVSMVFFAGFFVIKQREEAHKQQMLQAESEILQLRNEKLAADLNAKNSKLMSSAAQMAHKNEILNNIKQELKTAQSENNSRVPQLIRMLDRELESEDYWEEFNLYFNQVDTSFVHDLIRQHPKITQNDIRLCTLMRINLSTKEIASLLNVSTRAVEQSKYRLKKRLDLGNEEDLLKYISGF